MKHLPDVRELDLKKAAETAIELQGKSTPVIGWYGNTYGDGRSGNRKTVRGPFGRWFWLDEGSDPDRNGKSQGCLADPADDILYASYALNNLASIAQGYLILLEATQNPDLLVAVDWKRKAQALQMYLNELSEANGKKFDALVAQSDVIEKLSEEISAMKTALEWKEDEYVREVGAWKIIQRNEEELKNLREKVAKHGGYLIQRFRYYRAKRSEANERILQLEQENARLMRSRLAEP